LPLLHRVEVERNVERLGLPDQHGGHDHEELSRAERVEQRDLLARQGSCPCSAEVSGFALLFFAQALRLRSLPRL
jgi:hypothetical protein